MLARNKHTKAAIVAEHVRVTGTHGVRPGDFDRDMTKGGLLAWESDEQGVKVDWDTAEQVRDQFGDPLFVDAKGDLVPGRDVELVECCREEGCNNPVDLEGYDGRCGACADLRERHA